jgi:hypothetical protein
VDSGPKPAYKILVVAGCSGYEDRFSVFVFRRHVADLGLRSKSELATRRARWNELTGRCWNATRPNKVQAGRALGWHFPICLPEQLRQSRPVDGDAARLVLCQHLGLHRLGLAVSSKSRRALGR